MYALYGIGTQAESERYESYVGALTLWTVPPYLSDIILLLCVYRGGRGAGKTGRLVEGGWEYYFGLHVGGQQAQFVTSKPAAEINVLPRAGSGVVYIIIILYIVLNHATCVHTMSLQR